MKPKNERSVELAISKHNIRIELTIYLYLYRHINTDSLKKKASKRESPSVLLLACVRNSWLDTSGHMLFSSIKMWPLLQSGLWLCGESIRFSYLLLWHTDMFVEIGEIAFCVERIKAFETVTSGHQTKRESPSVLFDRQPAIFVLVYSAFNCGHQFADFHLL